MNLRGIVSWGLLMNQEAMSSSLTLAIFAFYTFLIGYNFFARKDANYRPTLKPSYMLKERWDINE